MKLDSNVRRKFSASNFCSMPLFRNKKRPRFGFLVGCFTLPTTRQKFFLCLSFWPSLRSLNVNCDWNSRQIALHFFVHYILCTFMYAGRLLIGQFMLLPFLLHIILFSFFQKVSNQKLLCWFCKMLTCKQYKSVPTALYNVACL